MNNEQIINNTITHKHAPAVAAGVAVAVGVAVTNELLRADLVLTALAQAVRVPAVTLLNTLIATAAVLTLVHVLDHRRRDALASAAHAQQTNIVYRRVLRGVF